MYACINVQDLKKKEITVRRNIHTPFLLFLGKVDGWYTGDMLIVGGRVGGVWRGNGGTYVTNGTRERERDYYS